MAKELNRATLQVVLLPAWWVGRYAGILWQQLAGKARNGKHSYMRTQFQCKATAIYDLNVKPLPYT